MKLLSHRMLFQLLPVQDAAADIRLIRRMDRDCTERGRTVAQVLEQYHQTVRPMHEQYVEPSKLIADMIVHSITDTTPSTEKEKVDTDTGTTPNSKSHGSLDVACTVLANHLMVVANLPSPTKTIQYTMEEALKQMNITTSSSLPSPPQLP
jgi:Phosphoribulokinase / Uridine kinase family